jgi:hypothetical protein
MAEVDCMYGRETRRRAAVARGENDAYAGRGIPVCICVCMYACMYRVMRMLAVVCLYEFACMYVCMYIWNDVYADHGMYVCMYACRK